MIIFDDYLKSIDNIHHRKRVEEVLSWIIRNFSDLTPKIAWNQPMFSIHDTFIIGFSVSKKHLAVAPEMAGINKFSLEILNAGYEHTKNLFKIKWEDVIDFTLLKKIIDFNIVDKKDCITFWRK